MIDVWFAQKFLVPLCRYYTPEATVVYGLLLAAAAYGTYRLLQRLKVKIDRRLIIGVVPFIIFGGIVRALRDHGVFTSDLLCSPPIYFLVFAITIVSLLGGLFVQKNFKFPYYKMMAATGTVLVIIALLFVSVNNIGGFSFIAGMASIWAAVLLGLSFVRPKILSRFNAGVLWSHMLDASSTFTGVAFFGYYEQHVIPNLLMGSVGPWVFIPVKFIVVLAVLLLIDKYAEDKFFGNFLKMVVLILGLAQGTRDFLTISMLVV